MTIPEALGLAIKTLREKADIERVHLHMVESAPTIARQIDAHATRRFHRLQDAISVLTVLRREAGGAEPEQADERAEVEL